MRNTLLTPLPLPSVLTRNGGDIVSPYVCLFVHVRKGVLMLRDLRLACAAPLVSACRLLRHAVLVWWHMRDTRVLACDTSYYTAVT